jgi:hypothetical protein
MLKKILEKKIKALEEELFELCDVSEVDYVYVVDNRDEGTELGFITPIIGWHDKQHNVALINVVVDGVFKEASLDVVPLGPIDFKVTPAVKLIGKGTLFTETL